jgi:preprotein translocase subunit YajC
MLEYLAAGSAAAAGPSQWVMFVPWIGIAAIFWFLLIRPQMRQQKAQRDKIAGIKKGDQVLTAGGLVGKVIKVDDEYAEIEIAQGVRVKALKATIGDILSPIAKPAND